MIESIPLLGLLLSDRSILSEFPDSSVGRRRRVASPTRVTVNGGVGTCGGTFVEHLGRLGELVELLEAPVWTKSGV